MLAIREKVNISERRACRLVGLSRSVLHYDAKPDHENDRKHGFSDASFYTWRAKFGGMEVSEARRLKGLEVENARLKKLLAEAMLDMEALKVVVKGKP